MQRSPLLMALAGVFGVMAVLQFVLALRFSLFFLTIAAAFGLASYLVWYHASGRMADRVRRRAAAGEYERREQSRGGFGAGPREQRFRDARGPFAGVGRDSARRGSGQRGDAEGGGSRRRGGPRGQRARNGGGQAAAEGPTPAEAARVLGVTPDADRARIKEAYRQKVKTVHPDTDEGSEEAFKRVNRAYETLTDDG
ncbi:J domain-containing protein [Natronoarchaeum mannanilyticum]|uniref:J domain-containing protein n=1 Tax=Natronoarchaeum mannanilyticum TaxID=926360 RepID=UPI0031DD424A